jgi:hypothetical protein
MVRVASAIPRLLILLVILARSGGLPDFPYSIRGTLHEVTSAATDDPLKSLRPTHPRLLLLNAELPRVKRNIKDDPPVRSWYERLQEEAQKMLAEPPVKHRLAPDLLAESRAALRRISTLAGLYRLDGDRRKAARARAEMLAAASLPDWNPPHFLDTAEMTNALGIGYDWLFDYLSPEDRTTIRKAIVEKGLQPGLKDYAQGTRWTVRENNWNQVCNGGLTVGALAIADEESELAHQIIDRARESIMASRRAFAPDGGGAEGPGYWNYATRYEVFFLAALETALGTDLGFKQRTEGLPDTGLFRIYSIGPLKLQFNYSDARESIGSASQMFWFAVEFERPLYAQHEIRLVEDKPDIFHLLWYRSPTKAAHEVDLPLDTLFRGVNVAFFRSAWRDPQAVYVGFKGGNSKSSHSQLDLGTFVLDAMGYRWAVDLGPDSYELPGYFDFSKQRWSYYRNRTEGHNTLTIDGENQDPAGKAPIVAFSSTPPRAFAVTDLSDPYKGQVTHASRGVALIDRRQVLVQDELQAPRPVEIVWNFHTRAQIALQGDKATLTQGKAQMQARILSPTGAHFEVISANPPLPQAQQPDVRNLIIRLPEKTREVRIVVLLTPDANGDVAAPRVEPLDAWVAAGRLKDWPAH